MIDVADVLDKLGIEYQDIGDDYRISCWFHEEKHPSMSINKEGGYYHCFSCKSSGSLFDILNYFLGIKDVEAIKYLSTFDRSKEDQEDEGLGDLKTSVLKWDKEKKTGRIIVTIPLHNKIDTHPYLKQRGFTNQEILEWEMGIVTEEPYIGWILIPIIQNGRLRNYFLRSTTSNRKRYGKYPRTDVLMGLDSASDTIKPIYVVEGAFDMIFLRRAGIQAVASLSNRLHKRKIKKNVNLLQSYQIEKLSRYGHVVIVPDSDQPGLQLVRDAIPLLKTSKVGVCTLPEGKKDTAECSVRELLQIVSSEQPLLEFINTERYKTWNLEALLPQISNKSGMTKQQAHSG